jgi:leader peptidase (prepilin peptidase)/N-methyltransferase
MQDKVGWIAAALLALVVAATSFALFELPVAAASCALGWTMLAIAMIDARHFIVPDILSLPAIPAGLLVTWALDDGTATTSPVLANLGAAVLGSAALYAIRAIYRRGRGREGLGLGDVKLAAVAGAWTGFTGIVQVLLFASVFAILFILVANSRRLGSLSASTAIAFGAFLAPAIWFVWCAARLGLDLGP